MRHRNGPSDRARESAPGACGFVEGGAQGSGKFQGIVIGPEVKKEYPRLFGQHVAVNCRHFDAVGTQGAHHFRNFGADQGIVASNRRFAAASRLEINCGRATGLAAGLFCVVLSVAAAGFFVLPPGFPLYVQDSSNLLLLLLFILVTLSKLP